VYTFPTRYLPPRSSVATQDSSPAKVFTVAESPIQHPEIKRTRLRLVQGGSTSHRKCERPGGYGYLPCSLMAAEGIELNAVRCAQDLPATPKHCRRTAPANRPSVTTNHLLRPSGRSALRNV